MSTFTDGIFGFGREAETDSSSRSMEAVLLKSRWNAVRRQVFEAKTGLDDNGAETVQDRSAVEAPIASMSRTIRRDKGVQERFILLEKWEGVVLRVTSETFWARLADLTGDAPDEEAEFPLEMVPPLEKEWLVSGNIFYWRVGYRDTPAGRKLESEIRFRRIPSPNKYEIRRAEEEAADIADAFGWK